MKCRKVRSKIHDYMDQRLDGRESREVEDHLSRCPGCHDLYLEFRQISGLLAGRLTLSPVAGQRVFHQVRSKGRLTWSARVVGVIDQIYTFSRDLDRGLVWSKVVALPVSLTFFALIMVHFSPVRIQELTYAVISSSQATVLHVRPLMVRQVQARQKESQLEQLIDTAWRIPYEDSLSLVAEITPEGNAQIDDILEYPKSAELLDAVALTLRNSRFHSVSKLSRPFLIYSFQKIDVYETERGL